MNSRKQRGQALILIALAFVGLAAFIGLAVDAGILFIQYGHLRRGVDAASLSAANQFREGWTIAEMTAAGLQVLALNGLDPTSIGVAVETCDNAIIPGDPKLCYDPPRKLVRVTGRVTAYFAFLPIIGFDSTSLSANAISEAASIDIVLVIDSSESMTFDTSCSNTTDDDAWAEEHMAGGLGVADGDPNDGCGANPQIGGYADDYFAKSSNCNPVKQCRPFRDVQDAALALTTRLLPPYDRMAIVTFDKNAVTHKELDYQSVSGLSNGAYITALQTQIMALDLFVPDPVDPCPDWATTGPQGCTSTNTAGGLAHAAKQFYDHKREEAVWIVILLSDGGANAAKDNDDNWICPGAFFAGDWVEPYCRDNDSDSRHINTNAMYDADDAARDVADFLGCLDKNSSPHPGTCAALAPDYGDGAVIFTIGLGDQMTDNTHCDPFWGSCDEDAGEQLLRYIANVGDDGNPLPASDLCVTGGYGVGESCGNYYFSPSGSGLLEVFEAIASRIFTRITH